MNFQSISLPLQVADGVRIGNSGFLVHFSADLTVYYKHLDPIDFHDGCDRKAMLLRAARFAAMGVRRADIEIVFGISRATLQRAIKKLRAHGEASFQQPAKKRGFSAISDEQKAQAETLLATRMPIQTVAITVGIVPQTLYFNIWKGNVAHPGRNRRAHSEADRRPVAPHSAEPTDCSALADDDVEPPAPSFAVRNPAEDARTLVCRDTREHRDRAATLGRGATDSAGRIAASVGMLTAVPVRFDEPLAAVAGGSVLTALPTLLQEGLVRNAASYLSLPKGYYGLQTILIFMAFLFMARVHNPEALHHQSPGEWGRILGLDRCPEAKTLRHKIKTIAANVAGVKQWQQQLTKDWMVATAARCATLSVDGHTKVYTGRKGRLPKQFVSRQKLCLPAASSYWLNALGGQPLLCLHQDLDPTLTKVLENDLVPSLEQLEVLKATAPNLLTTAAMAPALTLVFDREGWSRHYSSGWPNAVLR
ncbi:MAG: helix-turn-helix domain-containing protein [Aestuariivita sp.]|nr:helix-turn-helix domain-containing protein [Aestuariivita sp.]MCY4203835.1 helix-turn-helix domain-containing protein [Aestuariivita sp.]